MNIVTPLEHQYVDYIMHVQQHRLATQILSNRTAR